MHAEPLAEMDHNVGQMLDAVEAALDAQHAAAQTVGAKRQ